jgi:hypothetical protein
VNRDLYANVSARIVAELERGAAPWIKPWSATPSSVMAPTSRPSQRAAHEPLYDIDLQTGVSFEVFYSDRTLETFGRGGAGWFWWSRRRGFSPNSPATGPFATSYAAYRNALHRK